MSFGVYFHIPYCLQRCTYCDFATYVFSEILAPADYVKLVLKEMDQRQHLFPARAMDTLYFGGGTPSLLEPALLEKLILHLETLGFSRAPGMEMTIEINPATLTPEKIEQYISLGFNRFSVGAQSFNNNLLKSVNRQHSANDTRETLNLLQKHNLNYNFDILFALPGQTLEDLALDLKVVGEYLPPHISPYCLTVPEGHPLSKGRPLEDQQVEMFHMIERSLGDLGYNRYEISNFSLPGKESRHNSLYWEDQEYWGIGLSAHSYSKSSKWGHRFWNASNIKEYERQISTTSPFPAAQEEFLEMHQALTDFCHTSLRMRKGLSEEKLRAKFPDSASLPVISRLNSLFTKGWVRNDDQHWTLTPQGVLLSNLVFQELTFLANELSAD